MEPERSIEKLLRSFAKKRGDSAGPSPEMPATMRRRLHEEIDRGRDPNVTGQDRNWMAGWMFLLRPQWVAAACVLTIAIASAMILFRDGKSELAAVAPAAGESPAESPASPDESRQSAPRLRRSVPRNQVTHLGTLTVTQTSAMPALDGAVFKSAARADAGVFVDDGVTYFRGGPNMSESVLSRERQVVATATATVVPEILTTFQVMREGNNIRVIDADGSVYTGTVRTAADSAPVVAREQPPFGGGADRDSSAVAAVGGVGGVLGREPDAYFEAIGTNVSLRQRVVFAGTLTSTNPAPMQSRGEMSDAVPPGTVAPVRGVVADRRVIRGRVVLEDSREVLIEAEAAP